MNTRLIAATLAAKDALRPGYKLTISKGGGPNRRIIFDHWRGDEIVSRTGAGGYYAPDISKVNGAPVDFNLVTGVGRKRKHLFIPDSQVRPGVPLDHLGWIGRYAVEKRPDVIIHAGDFADMPSLSSYDKGKRAMEGRRISDDINAAKHGWDVLNAPIEAYNTRQRREKKRLYRPEKHITLGNHEDRITRVCQTDAQLEGLIGVESLHLDKYGWTVHPFLNMMCIDGVTYSHYFANPFTGRPWGGMMQTRLKNIGFSFTMGHVQLKEAGEVFLANGKVRRGLVAGAAYLHDEEYKGPQGNHHWRGVLIKHQVCDGNYDLMEVSLDYLCRRYEGVPLADFKPRIFAGER